MRVMMGLLKDRHGTYYARHKVPLRLQEATARILENGKAKQVCLKRSLGTKKLQEAHVRAKPVQMEFDRIIARAEATLRLACSSNRTASRSASVSLLSIDRHVRYSHNCCIISRCNNRGEVPEQTLLAMQPSNSGRLISRALTNGASQQPPRLLPDQAPAVSRGRAHSL
jgi:hypothetical protein